MKKSLVGNLMLAVLVGSVLSSALFGKIRSEASYASEVLANEVYEDEIGEITESEEELNESLMYMEVQAGTLNVRDDVNGHNLSKVHKGDRFLIFAEKEGWYLIMLENEQAGWVCGRYVDVYYPNGSLYQLASAYNKDAGVTQLAQANQSIDPASAEARKILEAQAQLQMAAYQAALEAQNITAEQAEIQMAAYQTALEAQAQAQMEAYQAALEAQNQAALEAQAQMEAYQAALEAQAQAQMEAYQAALEAQKRAANEALKSQPWLTKEWTSLTNSELIQWAIASCITPDMSAYDKCVAVNNFLCKHMTYDLSYYTTHDALMYGVGRCQGYANAFKDIMNTLGIPTDYVRGYANGGRHGWNRVNIGGVYYYIDVTWNDSTSSNDWLMISEAQMARDHVVTQYSASNTQ